MIHTTFNPNIKANPLPLFAWATSQIAFRPRERVRWSVDRCNRVTSFRREVLHG